MSIQQDREQFLAEQQKVMDQQELLRFFRKYPELNSIANERLLIEFLNNDPVNQETLEEARAFLGSRLAIKSDDRIQQDQQAQQQADLAQAQTDRAGLESMILEALPATSRAFESARFKYRTYEQLEARLAELTRARRLRSMSISELHQYLKDEQREQGPAPKIEQVTLTRAELLRLSGQQMRLLLYRADGSAKPGVREQVDAIIRGN